MLNIEDNLLREVQRIQSLDIVPSILDIICRTTGMRFSAVARVTEHRWIACVVKDDINFGLNPGQELQIETTICNEIRDHAKPVIIDHVDCDVQFMHHPTPKMYGFQSYISIPIILKDGTFFGTLCAIDPDPVPLKASNALSMFNMFADLIAYHLLTQDKFSEMDNRLKSTQQLLNYSLDDNRQFSFIAKHTLQEPLRKLQMVTDMMVRDNSLPNDHALKQMALKANRYAKDFSNLIAQVQSLSEIENENNRTQEVDLNVAIKETLQRLQLKIMKAKARIDIATLPVIQGNPAQITDLFYNLLDNALKFSRSNVPPHVKVYVRESDGDNFAALNLPVDVNYTIISVEDNGMGIESAYLNKIFYVFTRLNPEQFNGIGMGLAQSQKIMRRHSGAILVNSTYGVGTIFSLIFPK